MHKSKAPFGESPLCAFRVERITLAGQRAHLSMWDATAREYIERVFKVGDVIPLLQETDEVYTFIRIAEHERRRVMVIEVKSDARKDFTIDFIVSVGEAWESVKPIHEAWQNAYLHDNFPPEHLTI